MSADVPRPPGPGQDPPARRLRLVHPAPPPKPDATPRTRGGRRQSHQNSVFSRDEETRLRAALRGARAQLGTWVRLASAMGVPIGALDLALRGRNRVSAALAVRLARALGKPLESLYAPPSDARTCPTCGARRAP